MDANEKSISFDRKVRIETDGYSMIKEYEIILPNKSDGRLRHPNYKREILDESAAAKAHLFGILEDLVASGNIYF